MGRWVTISDGMKILGKSRRTIWRKIQNGSIQSRNQAGFRLIYIRGGGESRDEETEPAFIRNGKTEPRFTNGPIRDVGSRINEFHGERVSLPSGGVLSLIEALFEIREVVSFQRNISVRFASLLDNSSGQRLGTEEANQWKRIFFLLDAAYQTIGKFDLKRGELQQLFSTLLTIRNGVQHLVGGYAKDRMVSDDPEEEEIITNTKLYWDEFFDQFDQALNSLKRLIAGREMGE